MANNPEKTLRALVIVDDQASTSLLDERVLEAFDLEFPTQDYVMKFASKACQISLTGQEFKGLAVRGTKCKEIVHVPQGLSCPNIIDTSSGVAPVELKN